MSGPYFRGQQVEECGCYYPDIICLGDNTECNVVVFHCITHGEITRPIDKRRKKLPLLSMPSNEWREDERQRLKKMR